MVRYSSGKWFAAGVFVFAYILSLLRPGGIAGAVSGYLTISILPGLAFLAVLYRNGLGGVDSYLYAGALSPILSVLVAIPVLIAGYSLDISIIVLGAVSLFLFCSGLFNSGSGEREKPFTPGVLVLVAALTMLIVIPLLSNGVLRLRSDAWFHASVAECIAGAGLPPGDPYYAGMGLRYFWGYHVYLLLLRSACGISLFDHMAVINVIFFTLYLLAVYRLSMNVSRSGSGPVWSMILVVFGINIIGCVFLLGRAVLGETSGLRALSYVLHGGVYTILQNLSFNYMGSLAFFLDKFMVGSPFGMTLVMFLLVVHFAIRWIKSGNRRSIAMAGLFYVSAVFFHTVVGFSILICLGAVFLVLALLAGMRAGGGGVKRCLAGFLVLIALTILCIPYLHTILSLGGGERAFPLTFNRAFTWTVLAAGILPVCLFLVRLRRNRCRETGEVFLVVLIGAVLLLGSFARMPLGNANKFVYLVFLPLIVLAGDGVALVPDLLKRTGPLRYAALFLVAIGAVATASLGFAGYILDPGEDVPVPVANGRLDLTEAEERGYRWVRENTPVESIFLNGERRDIPVLGGRRQLWTKGNYAISWGYDSDSIGWRKEIVDSLYSGRPVALDLWNRLSSLRSPVYLVFRPEDADAGGFDHMRSVISERYREVFYSDELFIIEILPGIE